MNTTLRQLQSELLDLLDEGRTADTNNSDDAELTKIVIRACSVIGEMIKHPDFSEMMVYASPETHSLLGKLLFDFAHTKLPEENLPNSN
jgi:hypothetical protein